MRKVRYFLWLGLLAALPLGAAVRTPAVFGDSMVLQRNRPLPVWGWAERSPDYRSIRAWRWPCSSATARV